MQTIDLMDAIRISVDEEAQGISLHCKDPSVPKNQENLVYRAADLILRKAGRTIGLDIELTKQIPMGAGLGGGSSDAAATIAGVVYVLGLKWSVPEMARLGAQLGSDVPFFFFGPTALVQGCGEDVRSISLVGEQWIVLIFPGFPIETKWAYERLAASRGERLPLLSDHLVKLGTEQPLSWNALLPWVKNDFEQPLFAAFPCLKQIQEELLCAGALKALVSGSGATVFGVFPDETTAKQAKQALEGQSGRLVFAVKTCPPGERAIHPCSARTKQGTLQTG